MGTRCSGSRGETEYDREDSAGGGSSEERPRKAYGCTGVVLG